VRQILNHTNVAAFVGLGCHSKIPQTTLFQGQFIFPLFWRLRSPKSRCWQGLVSGEGFPAGLQMASFITMSSHGLSSVFVGRESESQLSWCLFLEQH
jgi:hypothetical protein